MPHLHHSDNDSQLLHSSFDSVFGDDYRNADLRDLPYVERVANAMSDFNGKSDKIVGLFLFEDFLLTNTMLYLLWCAYIPLSDNGLLSKSDFYLANESVFVSHSQQNVFLTSVIIYTLITIVPQVACSLMMKPSSRYSYCT